MRHYPRPISDTQRCPKCKVFKQLPEFNKHSGRRNGVTHYCKSCEGDKDVKKSK